MKVLAIVAMLAIAAAEKVSARNIEGTAEPRVVVCVETVTTKGWVTMISAQDLASRMFDAVGLEIYWRNGKTCPADGIRVRLSYTTRESDHPNAYAYAMPYEGTHIVLLWNRIARGGGSASFRFLLAHVLVHEVTHILQGEARHSDTGVMKAIFTAKDIADMEYHPLSFTEEDVELIHTGMHARQSRLVQRALK